ncbi:MAG: DNA-binding domain-containing protein [Pseudomonadota bacterium]
MPDLNTTQRQFQNAVLGGDPALAAALVLPSGRAALERLAIYRNHFLESLVDTLETTYPVTQRLVGAHYFSALAKRHVAADPPRDPWLRLYGSGLAATIELNRECQAVPYLSDVARLEWALHEAAEAQEDSLLEVGEVCRALEELGAGAVIAFTAPLRQLRCAWPADLIWRFHASNDITEILEIGRQSRWLHVSRDERGPFVVATERGPFVLQERLIAGESLATACEAALASDATLDITRALADLIEQRTIVSVTKPRGPG